MNARKAMTGSAVILTPTALLVLMFYALSPVDSGRNGTTHMWYSAVNPGPLSAAHAQLENNCAACHAPVQGVTPSNCIVCHANDASLLKRQPTAFHAEISSCSECHLEHKGRDKRPTSMDHGALAKIALGDLAKNPDPNSEDRATMRRIVHWLTFDSSGSGPVEPGLSPIENSLDCTSCHGNDDRHFGLFGADCASCHGTQTWTIPAFRHPPSKSMDCGQCHQAPPSHYMGHFAMISKKVAAQPHAQVDQCYKCHQTTAWPDILGKGWYKHH